MRMIFLVLLFSFSINLSASNLNYPVIDTDQDKCFDTLNIIQTPEINQSFYGQDAQYSGIEPEYRDNENGTITDLNTGLIWQKYLLNNKFTYKQAKEAADTFSLAGYNDWRLPTIKELYSLINFNGCTGVNSLGSSPFIDTDFFEFRYGDVFGERFIDAQYVSCTEYVGFTMNRDSTVFGVNFADGRIKGYGITMPFGKEKLFEVRFVRGDTNYGINDFQDNGDSTITDLATGLMWAQYDCGFGLNWQEALHWVDKKNKEHYLGHSDWRLPNAKELQSIVDYSRSPQTTNSPAIDPIFHVTQIVDEGGDINYPFYWTSTSHIDGNVQNLYTRAVYIAFGEALGFMEMPPYSGNFVLTDVHGAGAQRSDPKVGNPSNYPEGFGPQGDVIRIYNYIRLVRSMN